MWLRVALALAASPLAAQAPPAAVQHALETKYPGITKARWSATSDGHYTGEFRTSGAVVAATFSSTGQWVQSSTEIGAITLPDTVRKFIVKAYKGYRFVDTYRIDRSAQPAKLFEVRLEKPGESVSVQFEPNGSIYHDGRQR